MIAVGLDPFACCMEMTSENAVNRPLQKKTELIIASVSQISLRFIV